MKTRIAAGILIACFASNANAENHSVAGTVGGLGIGVEYTYRINNLISVRGSINGSGYSADSSESDIDYALDLDFDTMAVGIDFHPKGKATRFSLGFLNNNSSIGGRSLPTSTFNIGGTIYPASEVGTLTAEIAFEDSLAPYAGIGWNWRRDKPFGVTLDFGVASQDSPTSTLSADGPIAGDPIFQADLAEEQRQLDEDLEDFDLYPFAMLGFVFRFQGGN